MKIAVLTNEYPPHVYGGAGVHVENLFEELARLEEGSNEIEILCFGGQKCSSAGIDVQGICPGDPFDFKDVSHPKLMDTLLRNLLMASTLRNADIIHCHTWYTHLAGCLLKQLLGVPLVLTTHSLEPHRPWKIEQLGSAYRVSSWVEKTAYENADGVIAVSSQMKEDVQTLYGVEPRKVRVIYNGIDPDRYKPEFDPAILSARGISLDLPFILFVGRITRQKGIIHLIKAIKHLPAGIQVVLCAGMPDTEEIGREMEEAVELARKQTENRIIWIPEFLPKEVVISMYAAASVFVCPSVYEPFGIINLEAMACRTPVVASAVGGIPEVVVHGETGLLVPFEPVGGGDFEPRDPEKYSKDLASAIAVLLDSAQKRESMGIEARERVESLFSWKSIARQTLAFYREIVESSRG
jgi:glycogen synthase